MNSTPTYHRPGTTLIELLVAIGVLSSLITITLPMCVKIMRVRQLHRQRLVAVEALANQMDRLTLLPASEAQRRTGQLTLPAHLAEQLDDASLQLAIVREAPATRLRLSLTWRDRMGNMTQPVTLTGWIYPRDESP
jgi:type II secretory pathway pseudopilin PulG